MEGLVSNAIFSSHLLYALRRVWTSKIIVGARRGLGGLCLGLVLAGVCACTGNSTGLDADGAVACIRPPALSVPPAGLQSSLVCSMDLQQASRNPLLLVPGTTLTPEANYGWNYMPAFDALGWPYCTVELPLKAMGDIQIAAEHVVYAVREMHRRSGKPVQILGFSQGGMVPRWALKFWPDIRPMVSELVSLSGSNHGTLTAIPTCQQSCSPAYWQQKFGSRFGEALNETAEMYPGIDYTSIYTYTDEVVTPNTPPNASSALRGEGRVTNVAVQEVCPGSNPDHLALGSYDPLGYALAVDALDHPGPADVTRIAPTACAQTLMPGVDPASFASDYADYLTFIAETQNNAATETAEPALRCYVPGAP